MNKSQFEAKTLFFQQRINIFLKEYLQKNYSEDTRLLQALSYSLLSGGKRIRPLLSYATADALGVDFAKADYVAASVEMIHAYSLIHDDLPAMDDDDLRRGKPTCHVKFDEATAILAGDALQAMAFEVLTELDASPQQIVQMVRKLSQSCGASGMAGGQSLDLESENKTLNREQMEQIHQLKTGALISASVEMVGFLYTHSNTSKILELYDVLRGYGSGFGMAFQIIDDVLDIIGDENEIGKPVGSDESNNKSTYPSLIGLDASKQEAERFSQFAVSQLSKLPKGDSSYLKYLAEYLVSRQK